MSRNSLYSFLLQFFCITVFACVIVCYWNTTVDRIRCISATEKPQNLTCYAKNLSHVSEHSGSSQDTSLLQVLVKPDTWKHWGLSRWLNLWQKKGKKKRRATFFLNLLFTIVQMGGAGVFYWHDNFHPSMWLTAKTHSHREARSNFISCWWKLAAGNTAGLRALGPRQQPPDCDPRHISLGGEDSVSAGRPALLISNKAAGSFWPRSVCSYILLW